MRLQAAYLDHQQNNRLRRSTALSASNHEAKRDIVEEKQGRESVRARSILIVQRTEGQQSLRIVIQLICPRSRQTRNKYDRNAHRQNRKRKCGHNDRPKRAMRTTLRKVVRRESRDWQMEEDKHSDEVSP